MNWDLVIFDCDGVLVDSERLSGRVVAEEFTKAGLPLTTTEALQLFSGGSLAETAEYFEMKMGRKIPTDFETNYRRRSFEAFKKELKAVEGIETVLKQLPLPFCVASNGPINKMELNLGLTGLLDYFSKGNMFSAYVLKAWKPDPTLYLHAAKVMGVEPNRCVVIEDSMHGVKAANAANMAVMAYSPHADGHQFEAVGATVFKAMNELMGLLEGK